MTGGTKAARSLIYLRSDVPMGYTVPLRFIKVSTKRSDNRQFDVCICATRIVAMMSTENYQARKVISDERRNGTLINGCGSVKAKTAIFLDNGSVVSSPITVNRLMGMIDKANEKVGKTKQPKTSEYEDDEEEYEDEEEE